MDFTALSDAVIDMVWDHFPDELAADLCADEQFAACVRRLGETYDGDTDEINDAVFRIGADLCDRDGNASGLWHALEVGELPIGTWMLQRIRETGKLFPNL